MLVKGVECTRLWKSGQLIITVKHTELTIEKFLLALDLSLVPSIESCQETLFPTEQFSVSV